MGSQGGGLPLVAPRTHWQLAPGVLTQGVKEAEVWTPGRGEAGSLPGMKPGDGEDASGPCAHSSIIHQSTEVETAWAPADGWVDTVVETQWNVIQS